MSVAAPRGHTGFHFCDCSLRAGPRAPSQWHQHNCLEVLGFDLVHTNAVSDSILHLCLLSAPQPRVFRGTDSRRHRHTQNIPTYVHFQKGVLQR